MNEKKEPAYIAPLLFFIALVFRIPGLNRPLIFDEPKAIDYIATSFSGICYKLFLTDSQPPFYYYVLKCWAAVSADPFFLRTLTVILGSVICVILYKTAKAAFNKKTAYYTFIFAALSPQLIFQSQYLRPYCMGTFLSVLLVYIFLKFIDNKEERYTLGYFALFSVITALTLYSFYMSIYIILALNIFAVYFLRRNKAKLFLWAGSQVAAAFLFSFWVPFFLTQHFLISKGLICHLLKIENAKIGFYIGKIHVGNIARIALAYFHFDDVLGQAVRYSEYVKYGWVFISAAAVFIISMLICIPRIVKEMVRAERIKGASALFLLLIIVPALTVMIFSIGGDLDLWSRAVVNIKYFSQSSIYVLMLFSLLLISMKKDLLRRTLFSCAIIFFLLLDFNIYQFPSNIYKPAIRYLSDKGRDCKVVVLGPPTALGFFNTLSDKRFSDYLILKYDNSSKYYTEELKRDVKSVDRFYFYYLKSAENMVLFPGLDSKFEQWAASSGFIKKEEKKISDVLIISYFERHK